LPDGDLIIEKQILIDGLKTDDLCGFQKRVVVPHVKKVPVNLLMEDEGNIFGLNSGGKFDFKKGSAKVEGYNEEGGRGGNGRSLGIQLCEILLSPLVHSL
jgi:hypothetical protein